MDSTAPLSRGFSLFLRCVRWLPCTHACANFSNLTSYDSIQWKDDIGLSDDDGVRLGFLNAIGYFAGFVIGPFIAYIDDNFGRRWGIRFYGYTMIIGTVIGCVAGLPNVNGYALFVTGRAIIGFGMSCPSLGTAYQHID